MPTTISLLDLYNIMYDHMDPNGWWPGRSDWEVIWSTVLIQNTNWKNVDKALKQLYQATNFDPEKILTMPLDDLKQTIKSSGSYTRKAATIQNLAAYFQQYNFDLEAVQLQPKEKLRKELLAIKGIGPETADVILLYAIQKSEFVVDTYSRRLFACLGCEIPAYERAKKILEAQLPRFTLRSYQNFHAMIVMFNQENKLPDDFSKTFLANYQLKLQE
ncbi:endonuclease III domain-containing protein [Lactobacillus corticis]|uniref:Endonuclease III n=1 Tax=Lactobacillus corticis TaxID=2201249 RepID=A0A916QJY1_9LACO|nr:endonuclease III [Lactobacillus corticis]GFZ26556.1 endonuclease III [Lactobacillus corticis]